MSLIIIGQVSVLIELESLPELPVSPVDDVLLTRVHEENAHLILDVGLLAHPGRVEARD